jgi:hypothetical protein
MRLATLFALVVFTAFFRAHPVLAGEINIQLPLWDVQTKLEDGDAVFSGRNIQFAAMPGEPALPFRSIKLMLPRGADPSSVRAELSNIEISSLPGEWDVPPMPPISPSDKYEPFWPGKNNIVDGRDMDIYQRDAPFPGKHVHDLRVGEIRRQPVVEVLIAPLLYNPSGKRLKKIASATLTVNYEEKGLIMSGQSLGSEVDPVLEKHLGDKVLNHPSGSVSLQGADVRDSSGESGPAAETQDDQPAPQDENYGYAIITTNEIVGASGELANFIASKESRGFQVYLATEDQWGGGTGDAAAENIRDWLIANYLAYDLEYVLLIGDPDPGGGEVPMKMLWPRNNASDYTNYKNSPSDYYYADLTGNWDADGDGKYGEWGSSQDFQTGGVDRFWDVLVGRIPYYGSISDLDSILAKFRAYELEPEISTGWRENVLLPMEPSDGSTPGYHLGDAIRDDFVSPKGWSHYRIYDEWGSDPPEMNPCTKDNVTSSWNSDDFGLAIWWTHGSATSASGVMDNSHAATLDDAHPAFAFQASCHNGKPEASNNLAYTLLTNGAVNTVAASRVSWYFPGQTYYDNSPSNPGMAYEYAERLLEYGQKSAQALYNLKFEIHPGSNYMWMNYTDYNIYGDPEHSLAAVSVDSDGDGLTDDLEEATCSDPLDADSDDDGLSDGAEDANANGYVDPGETDPCQADSDGDGIQDGTESGIVDPVADPDGAGPLLGTDAAVFIPDADPSSTTDPIDSDSDGDGLSDGEEDLNANGRVDAGESDPNDPVSPGEEPAQVPAASPVALVLAAGLLMALQAYRRKKNSPA